jgi:hypothetical protein
VVGGDDDEGSGPSRPTLTGLDDAVATVLVQMGLAGWTVPALAVGVPGLLVVLAVAFQLVGGAVWVPVSRRVLAGVGLRRRGRSPIRGRPGT